MKAKYAGDCDRCDDPIKRGAEIILKDRDRMLHPQCASGQEDGGATFTPKVGTFVVPELAPTAAPQVPRLPADPHGFYEDIPETEYHAHPTSLSVSGAKVLLKAPRLFDWQRTHPVHKNVWDFGSAAHKKVLGVGAELTVHEFDVDKVKSPKATTAWKTQQAVVRAAGGVLLLPEEYTRVCDMAEELSKNSLAMELLGQGKPEVSAFAVDEPTGVLRRSRFDWLSDTILSDYKSAANADPDGFGRVALNFGYFMQAAWYLDLAAELGHPAQAFAFIVQEKEAPYLVSVVELDREALQLGRERNRQALEIFRDCTESDIWPGYQTDGCFSTISLPRYAFYEGSAA